jgi:tetratricopeptide (TPR) repeat protein
VSGLPDDRADALDQQLRRDQRDRQVLSIRLLLRQERTDEALAAVAELRKLEPDSAEAWEIEGDIHRRRGDRKAAREAYQQAFHLDPTNADAERKYAEVVLFLGEEERSRRLQRELVDDPTKKHPEQKRNPALAIVYGCLFPGLGQLYNRQHEKGLAIFAAGALIVILLINGLVLGPYRGIPEAGRRHGGLSIGEQWEQWVHNLAGLPWWHWLLAILGLLTFAALHVYAVIDAAAVARQEAKDSSRLGIDAPT